MLLPVLAVMHSASLTDQDDISMPVFDMMSLFESAMPHAASLELDTDREPFFGRRDLLHLKSKSTYNVFKQLDEPPRQTKLLNIPGREMTRRSTGKARIKRRAID
jgi:hypothetical protein